MLGLHCCMGFLVVASWASTTTLPSTCDVGFLIAVASCRSVVHGFSHLGMWNLPKPVGGFLTTGASREALGEIIPIDKLMNKYM